MNSFDQRNRILHLLNVAAVAAALAPLAGSASIASGNRSFKTKPDPERVSAAEAKRARKNAARAARGECVR